MFFLDKEIVRALQPRLSGKAKLNQYFQTKPDFYD